MRRVYRVAVIALTLIAAVACDSDERQWEGAGFAKDTVYQTAGGPRAVPQQTQFVQPGSAQVPPGQMPRGAIRAFRAEIIDRNGFERPLVASTVLIPLGWQTQGGVIWNTQDTCGSGYNIDFRANAPDGFSGIHFFPMEQWEWNSMGAPASIGCPMVQITSVRQYIENLVQRARPGARILDFRPRMDIAEEFKQLNQTTPMPLGETRTWVEAGEALIGYNRNGVDIRESVASAVLFTLMRMQPMAGMPGSENLSGSTFPGFAMRAPNGQFDFKVAEMIRKFAQAAPEWSARIAQHNAKISGINIQGARERSQIIAQTGEEIRQMQADSWCLYNESSDRIARERSEAIRGVETYNDPYYGDTVQLDNTYNHAWQLNDGTYVLTDDPSFNPSAATGQDGRQLTPVP